MQAPWFKIKNERYLPTLSPHAPSSKRYSLREYYFRSRLSYLPNLKGDQPIPSRQALYKKELGEAERCFI